MKMKFFRKILLLGNCVFGAALLAGMPLCAETASLPDEENPPRVPVLAGDADHAPVFETREERDARMRWWRDAKFGMFIHFGLYSGLAGEWEGRNAGAEWIQKNVEIDSETYARAAFPRFSPSADVAQEWANLAKAAGCRYAVLTTKHHDGFALFPSRETTFDASDVFGRDLVREFVDAFRGNGLRVGFYHSVIDWHHPRYDNALEPALCYPAGQAAWRERAGLEPDRAAYQQFLKNQVRELLTNYGKIDVIWWDYSQGKASGRQGWDAPALIEMCRRLQPEIIMNNRLYAYSGFDKNTNVRLDLRCGDTMSPEKHIPARGYPDTDWETCMTVGDKWGFSKFDTRLKSPEIIIRHLQECAARGGNLLLNIGPRADGSVPADVASVFLAVGKWLEINGESIYGTRPFFGFGNGQIATQSADGKHVFLFLREDTDLSKIPAGERLGGNASTLCPVLKIEAARIF